jgi:SAM-dependent methyltransferase
VNEDAVRARFAATASAQAALEESRRPALAQKVRELVRPRGHEHALDSGAGTGALAFALAPLVRDVVAVDLVPELLAEARRHAAGFRNVGFVEADATRLPFPPASFDLAGTLRTLHHVARPELVLAELARVTRPGGLVLVVDQLASDDPRRAEQHERFERARDASHARCLSDPELRELFLANGLAVVREQRDEERRELGRYLDLAGCEGAARERAEALAPGRTFTTTLAWYLLAR